HRPYVVAGRPAGVSEVRILFRHVLRNLIEPLLVYYTLDIGTVIITFSTISFVGIGVPFDVSEWGTIVVAYQQLLLTHPRPAVAIGTLHGLSVVSGRLYPGRVVGIGG